MKYLSVKSLAVFLLTVGVCVAFWFLFFGGYFTGKIFQPDPTKARDIAPFFTGLVVPFLTLGSALLVYENLRNTARQNFSNSFFKLVEMHHKLRDSIDDKIYEVSAMNDTPSKGKDFFDDLAERISYDYFNLPTSTTSMSEKKLCEVCKKAIPPKITPNTDICIKNELGRDKLNVIYDHYFEIHQSSLGHYFRNLYHIVKFVHDSPFRKSFKQDHLKILRAQLSNYELLLLAYNGLHEYGEGFYPLIERYKLLKSLNDESKLHAEYVKRIIDFEVLRKAYPHLQKPIPFIFNRNFKFLKYKILIRIIN